MTHFHLVVTRVSQLLYCHVRPDAAANKCRRIGKCEGVTHELQTRRLNGLSRVVDVTIDTTYT